MKKYWLLLIFSLLLYSCSQEKVVPPCITGECDAFISIELDQKGYYHKKLSQSLTYFPLYIEASDVSPEYKYNGVSVVEGWFDTNTYWELKDSAVFIVPLYASFGGLKTSPYWSGTKLPVKNKLVYLSQFAGYLVPVIQQDTRVYFEKYEANLTGFNSEYKPKDKYLWSKRIVGPIPIELKGDTIEVYAKVIWEAGSKTVEKNDLKLKIILE